MTLHFLINQIPIVCCAITGIVMLGRLHNSIRYLAVHALLSAFTEINGALMAPGNNHSIFIVYLPLDFLLVVLACKDFVRRSFAPLFVGAAVVFLTVYTYVLFTEGATYLPFEAIVTSWILQALFWFLVLMRNLREPLRHQTLAIYLFAGGIMLYTCTSIPMWAMFRFNMEHYPIIANALQRISNIASMIRYAACGIGFILLADKQMPVVRHAIR